jgi:hypothetical protein
MTMAAKTAKKTMTDAHNRIVHFHNERDQAAAARRPKKFVLYHYTTADGLKGIVENDELWATSAYYLNDSTEIMYGYQLIDEALEVWRKKANPREDSMAGGLVYIRHQSTWSWTSERAAITWLGWCAKVLPHTETSPGEAAWYRPILMVMFFSSFAMLLVGNRHWCVRQISLDKLALSVDHGF